MNAMLYAFFFLSGAAALVYQVAWVRTLSLVFGGSHLAVATVLSVFMGGLALGSALFGRRADHSDRLLRLYGMLELGIGASALAFLALAEIYPVVYAPLARLSDAPLYLSTVRVTFAVLAMIVPTTLMGGTLPVMTRFVSRRGEMLGRRVSYLYGLNTLGAVAGCLAGGFFLLKTLGVTATVLVAVAVNVAVGLVAMALRERSSALAPPAPSHATRAGASDRAAEGALGARTYRLVLFAIGASGFCALGYEVLWTRMLALVVGTSTYSFTIILVAFLTGISVGSYLLGLTPLANERRTRPAVAVVALGAIQVAIGLSALSVTVLMRGLPSHALALQDLFLGERGTEFGARQLATAAVAFTYLFVPASLGGAAFPLAAAIVGRSRKAIGAGVGETLTTNTIGCILGAAVSGFVLVHAVGTERSLQLLALLNVTAGLLVVASLARRPIAAWSVGATATGLAVALAAFPDWGRAWDAKYFAIFRNNQRSAFDSEWKARDALENTDVLYYFEGANETISVIHPKGGHQSFIVNGRSEATTVAGDLQLQRALGHIPMLLHPAPARVFVLGTGTGMTLGSTSVHPAVERIVLAEIEPGVLGAARTFARWNHRVLDDPRLQIVFNDGRNFLATTDEQFDVITADPIHPWSGGAAYLYTDEYFASLARRLRPGGVMAQWLPLYELSVRDVATVVRTLAANFREVRVWMTYWDAVLVASNDPIVLDEAELARRLSAAPEVLRDLAAVQMGTAEDLLNHFILGDRGARAFAAAGLVNTDDNLFLEFSAPESMGVGSASGDLIEELGRRRESVLPYLVAATTESERAAQQARWARNLEAARLYDPLHALAVRGRTESPQAQQLAAALEARYPRYAPYRFVRREIARERGAIPRLAGLAEFPVTTEGGGQRTLRISAVKMKIGDSRAAVVFVDNERRKIYGQRYLDGAPAEIDGIADRFADDTLARLQPLYARLTVGETGAGRPPDERAIEARIKAFLAAMDAGL